MLTSNGLNNCVSVNGCEVFGEIKGSGNNILIDAPLQKSSMHISISGDNNSIIIKNPLVIRGLRVAIGNHVPVHNCNLTIGDNFSIEPNSKFLIFNSGCGMSIGSDCMFSSDIVVRIGELPHLIYKLELFEYADKASTVKIGNHVWVGERSYFTKSAAVPDECIVAACSVVTRSFNDKNVVLGGNPASVVKRGIKWLRNVGSFRLNPEYEKSYIDFSRGFPF